MFIEKLQQYELLHDIARLELEYFRSPWSYQMLLSSMMSGCDFIVAKDGDKLVGYGGFYASGDITNIAVDTNYRSKGLGQKIVEKMLELAAESDIEVLFLEVRASNTIAINLYDKCGFKYINTRKRYYEDGEDALIYSREV